MTTRLLTSSDCWSLFSTDEFTHELEMTLVQYANGGIMEAPPQRVMLDSAPQGAAIVPMTATDITKGLFCTKVLVDHPQNRAKGLPAQRSTIALFSSQTGECLGLIDGYALTQLRTASMTLLATRTLANRGAQTLGIIGAGALAHRHAIMLCKALELSQLLIWSRNPEHATASARNIAEALPGTAVRATDSIHEVCAHSDIVCTLTPSETPLIDASMLHPGLHINAAGSPPRPQFREIDEDAMEACHLFADDARIALRESGNLAHMSNPPHITELAEVVSGAKPGRHTAHDITLYNSIGVAYEDLACADYLLRKAAAQHVGARVALRP
ncbi:ornithine cyclodeaminase family protein [Bifidobacterium subtile]|jgi:ornithine cyclodeaminase/alanine dehydrogenase-like protein (mu-crystallin family)|uniref:Ornithine cyclodeaminase n=3 Tax=Bifidobacterium subtile TaxID=77635 RepID=A0A087DTL3_9BIFI|nr:ornithine cyclodeaminase family protein [Bifidobacterium subtile]KFI98863.1 ornithine cyclodeaminase [Bifidobacterium subtile]